MGVTWTERDLTLFKEEHPERVRDDGKKDTDARKQYRSEKQKANYDTSIRILCNAVGVSIPDTEHGFHPERNWRFDYAWVEEKVALEIEGGVWDYGRHNRPQGYINDMEKYNAAQLLNWKVIRCTPEQLESSYLINLLCQLLS